MADSAAATDNINKANICPIKSSRKIEKQTKFKFNDNNVNSNAIKIKIKLLRLKTIPKSPKKKRLMLNIICVYNIYLIKISIILSNCSRTSSHSCGSF